MSAPIIRSLLQNPEIVRSIRTQVRRKHDFAWIFLLYLFLMSFVYVKFVLLGHPATVLDSQELYNTLIFLQFSVFITVGPLQAVAAFAQEGDQGTRDFILMTPINRSSLIVGRLLGTPLLAYFLLALSLPFTFVCYLNGGVP